MVRALDDGYTGGGAEQRLKVPPNSIEAEQALIGGLMLNAQAWDKVADVVVVSDFYRKDHRLIFAAIGLAAGILSREVYSAILIMVILSTFVVPPVLKVLFAAQPQPTAPSIEELEDTHF